MTGISELSGDERVYLELRELFEKAGYRKFKMRKFEEYSLYLENKSFLSSENVIAFNDPNGKLLALKPDVTLSIVKNARATATVSEKVYYRESVYRFDKRSREYREINQAGLEYIGEVDSVQTAEICSLALKSMECVNENYIFAVSHMGFVTGLLDELDLDNESAAKEILACLKARNAHDLDAVGEKYGIRASGIEKIKAAASAPTEFSEALAVAKSIAETEVTKAAVKELEDLYGIFAGSPAADKIRLDFSVLNDIDYYNGIIFQGYAEGYSKILLSGGRYDKLLKKEGNTTDAAGAMGFAISLSELNSLKENAQINSVDIVLLYNRQNAKTVFKTAEKYRSNGKTVLVAKKIPDGVKYSEIADADSL